MGNKQSSGTRTVPQIMKQNSSVQPAVPQMATAGLQPSVPQIMKQNSSARITRKSNVSSVVSKTNIPKKTNRSANVKMENKEKLVDENPPLNAEDQKVAELAVSVANEEAKELVAAVEAVNIKKDLINGKRAELALNIFTMVAKKTTTVLPKVLSFAGVAGGAALTATGIGLPVAIGAAIIVASVMRAVNQRLQIRQLLHKQFNTLLYIIKNFAVIQQTLELLDVEYAVYDSDGNPVKESNESGKMRSKRAITHAKLSHAFQKALVEYSTLLSAQAGPEATSNGRVKKFFKKAKRDIGQLITASRVLNRIRELFNEIETQYFLEVAKFTTLTFYNENGFNKIKDIIKEGKTYHKLATADQDTASPDCSKLAKSGEEEEDAICIFTPEQLNIELQKDIEALYSLVKREDFEKATNIADVMSKGNDEILARAKTDFLDDMGKVNDIAIAKATDIVRTGAGVASTVYDAYDSADKMLKLFDKLGDKKNTKGGRRRPKGRRTVRRRKS
jgi:hypothetical protein